MLSVVVDVKFHSELMCKRDSFDFSSESLVDLVSESNNSMIERYSITGFKNYQCKTNDDGFITYIRLPFNEYIEMSYVKHS